MSQYAGIKNSDFSRKEYFFQMVEKRKPLKKDKISLPNIVKAVCPLNKVVLNIE